MLQSDKTGIAEIELDDQDELVMGDRKQELGNIAGFGGRRKAEWTVRFSGKPDAKITVSSKRAGVVRLYLGNTSENQ